jgi:hypothetical protein
MNNTFENNNYFEDKRLENTLENRIADKIGNIFEDAAANPRRYVRLILTKENPVFIKPGNGAVGVKEAIITFSQNGESNTIRFVSQKSSQSLVAIIRNNKYIAFAYNFGDNHEELLFETLRKDRNSPPTYFSVLLNTDVGTIALICDSRCEHFFYHEFYELDIEPNFYGIMLDTINGLRKQAAMVIAKEADNDEQEEA